jgi:DNA-binding transcriptional MocR family regulator
MNLKPQDVVVLLKIASSEQLGSYRQLANDLHISLSEIHDCLKRLQAARLLNAKSNSPRLQAVEEFIIHGVKYCFPAVPGGIGRGVPTSYAAPPLNSMIRPGGDYSPVWPAADGKERGYIIEPLYPTVPKAAMKDEKLYELLALVDAIREGRARERSLAVEELKIRLRK